MVTIGVDTHTETLAASVIDEAGRELAIDVEVIMGH